MAKARSITKKDAPATRSEQPQEFTFTKEELDGILQMVGELKMKESLGIFQAIQTVIQREFQKLNPKEETE